METKSSNPNLEFFTPADHRMTPETTTLTQDKAARPLFCPYEINKLDTLGIDTSAPWMFLQKVPLGLRLRGEVQT